jgi:hypothetical protein
MAHLYRKSNNLRRAAALFGVLAFTAPLASAQPAPAQPAPAQPTPAQPTPAQPTPVPAPSQPTPAPAQAAPPSTTPAQPALAPAPAPAPAPAESVTPGAAGEEPETVPAPAPTPAPETPQGVEATPAAAPPASPKAPASSEPPPATEEPIDDYDGASDVALVEEKPRPKNLSLGVAVDFTFPIAKTADFISKASIQGLSLDLRYYAWGNIGIGAGLALDSLSKKSTETVTWENATFTGTQVRELSYTPITLKGYYAWREQTRVIPYVAAGLGAARAVKRLTVGITGLAEASWHFAVVPEAGLQIPVGPTLLLTNVRLNYLPPSAGVGEHVFANFSFGLSIQ